MKEINVVKIKYRSKLMHKGEIAGKPYKEFEYDYISASTKSVKRYNNAIMLLMGINGCPHHLIDWLSDTMPESGYIHNTEVTRRSFIAFHNRYKKDGNKSYSEHTVIKAFQRLTEDGFLVPVTKGVFMINPMLYCAKSDEDRINSIKYMMEFKSGIETRISVEINKKR